MVLLACANKSPSISENTWSPFVEVDMVNESLFKSKECELRNSLLLPRQPTIGNITLDDGNEKSFSCPFFLSFTEISILHFCRHFGYLMEEVRWSDHRHQIFLLLCFVVWAWTWLWETVHGGLDVALVCLRILFFAYLVIASFCGCFLGRF